MKNNKGFTLIEIIITLGIILLITGIAVGSFVGISNKKKNEEWELIKGQIETSAEQYFTSNKYMFENLPNSGITGYVTVGELVSNNYLNKVVNPIDNQLVNACSKVEITYNNGKVIGTYRDYNASKDGTNCNFSTGTVEVRSNGAPEVTLTKRCTKKGNGGWCKGSENLTITINKGEKTVTSKKIEIDGTTYPLDDNTYTDSASSSNKKNAIVTIKNTKGTTVAKTSYYLDNVAPTFSGVIDDDVNSWNSRYVAFKVGNSKDSHSGFSSVQVSGDVKNNINIFKKTTPTNRLAQSDLKKFYVNGSGTYDGSKKKVTVTAYDAAGNSTSHEYDYTLYKSCQAGNIINNGDAIYGRCSASCGGGSQSVTQNKKDKNSGDSCTASVTSRACNTQSCYANSCNAVKVVGKDTDCTSSAGNAVSAQLQIVCNGKIDYINLKYYYPDNSQGCKDSDDDPAGRHYPGRSSNTSNDDGNYNSTFKNDSNINGAVFNLLGCGAKKVVYKYQVVADGKTIQNWTGWTTFEFKSASADSKKKICTPDKGAAWFN